jgi:hypothetical protein
VFDEEPAFFAVRRLQLSSRWQGNSSSRITEYLLGKFPPREVCVLRYPQFSRRINDLRPAQHLD